MSQFLINDYLKQLDLIKKVGDNVREAFKGYCFADYKEKVIVLLMRVTTVSVETQRIVQTMKQAAR